MCNERIYVSLGCVAGRPCWVESYEYLARPASNMQHKRERVAYRKRVIEILTEVESGYAKKCSSLYDVFVGL